MIYNWKNLDDNVAENVRINYDDYLTMYNVAESKLRWVKQLKEDCGLGLREAKEQFEILFDGGREMFVDTFGIKRIRQEKLKVLTHKLLTEELLSKFKDCDETKLKDILSASDIYIIEDLLNRFLEYESDIR